MNADAAENSSFDRSSVSPGGFRLFRKTPSRTDVINVYPCTFCDANGSISLSCGWDCADSYHDSCRHACDCLGTGVVQMACPACDGKGAATIDRLTSPETLQLVLEATQHYEWGSPFTEAPQLRLVAGGLCTGCGKPKTWLDKWSRRSADQHKCRRCL